MKKYAIYSDQVWLENKIQAASIHIEGEKIAAISPGAKTSGAKDYTGKVIMPGVIDAHVHINEPGRTDWEGFETATKAAARGGISTLVDMPLNSSPVVTTVAALDQKIASCRNKLFVNCGFWAGATKASVNDVIALIEKGCLGVKVFLSHSGIDDFPNISLEDLAVLMAGIKQLNVPVLAHCELDTLPADSEMFTYPRSYKEYLKSRPKLWENEAIKKFIGLAQRYQCKAHVVHLASDEMLDWLENEKEQNELITVETCPHYLLFNAETIADGDTLFKCAPPIREKNNSEHLKQGIKKGVIDFISSDHSPAPANIKEIQSGDFTKAWGGIAGLQFLLSASWTALKNEMTLQEFIPLLTSKPARFLGLQNRIGTIAIGYDADITIWQPDESFQVQEDMIEHKHKTTPYLHQQLFGKVDTTIVNGEVVFKNEVVGEIPFGKRFQNEQKIENI